MATEKLRLWEERSPTEDLSVLCKRGIQTRDGRADLTCKKSQRPHGMRDREGAEPGESTPPGAGQPARGRGQPLSLDGLTQTSLSL